MHIRCLQSNQTNYYNEADFYCSAKTAFKSSGKKLHLQNSQLN